MRPSRASALSRRSSSGSAMPKDLALIEGTLYPRLLKDKSSMSRPSPPCPSLALVTSLSQYRRHVVALAPARAPQIAAAAAVQVGGCVCACAHSVTGYHCSHVQQQRSQGLVVHVIIRCCHWLQVRRMDWFRCDMRCCFAGS